MSHLYPSLSSSTGGTSGTSKSAVQQNLPKQTLYPSLSAPQQQQTSNFQVHMFQTCLLTNNSLSGASSTAESVHNLPTADSECFTCSTNSINLLSTRILRSST